MVERTYIIPAASLADAQERFENGEYEVFYNNVTVEEVVEVDFAGT